MTDDLERRRQLRERKQTTRPAGAFSGLTGSKAVRANRVLAKVGAAEDRRDLAAGYAGRTPVPERITTALDLRMLYGPEVDRALGGEEPMVDEWESGERVPSFEQVQALAELTGFPVKFFYEPPSPPVDDGWICGPDGCRPLGDDPAEGEGEGTGRLF